jgi:hypothetical protein
VHLGRRVGRLERPDRPVHDDDHTSDDHDGAGDVHARVDDDVHHHDDPPDFHHVGAADVEHESYDDRTIDLPAHHDAAADDDHHDHCAAAGEHHVHDDDHDRSAVDHHKHGAAGRSRPA